MMHATSSPVKPPARTSELAQRLREAAELDSHLSEVEDARRELDQIRSRNPPPPPPSSPRTHALNRLVELATQELERNESIDDPSRATAIQSIRNVLGNLQQEYAEKDALAMTTYRGTYQRQLSYDEASDMMMTSAPRDSNHGMALLGDCTRGPIPGRNWRAAITSATLRHGRVEYEIRSELTSISEHDHQPTTGTSVVRRRYRDFDRLLKMINKALKPEEFVLIPNLPPKDVKTVVTGNRSDKEFVWNRRIALQLWLRYVCDHHVIRNSTLLREFLWEPNSSAVSNDSQKFSNMNIIAESALWLEALRNQQLAMEQRFNNSIVALTSMGTHIKMMISAYRRVSAKTNNLIKADASLARSLTTATKYISEWADFERSAGQNYSFASKFAEVLRPQEVQRTGVNPTLQVNNLHNPGALLTNASITSSSQEQDLTSTIIEEDALVSFSERDLQLVPTSSASNNISKVLINKDTLQPPTFVSASSEVWSLKAFQATMHLWGDEILPKMEASFVDPKKTSPYYKDPCQNLKVLGNRVACEWTELENLKCNMVRDAAIRLVEDQILHAREEAERWTSLREAIRADEVELSSLVALGDVGVNQREAMSKHDLDASSSSSSSSSPDVLERLDRLSGAQHGISPASNASVHTNSVHPLFDNNDLDANLDQIQVRFQEQEELHSYPDVGSETQPAQFGEYEESRHLNPFFTDEEED